MDKDISDLVALAAHEIHFNYEYGVGNVPTSSEELFCAAYNEGYDLAMRFSISVVCVWGHPKNRYAFVQGVLDAEGDHALGKLGYYVGT